MANWCSNVVWFEANEATIKEIKNIFLQMAEREKETKCGQLPTFIKEDRDWFFDIRWEEEDVLYYETRWCPNIEVMQKIAKHFGVGFTMEYEETGCLVYGKATFTEGILIDSYLACDDFQAYRYNEETDTYHFEGETYESDCKILEILLERKTALL